MSTSHTTPCRSAKPTTAAVTTSATCWTTTNVSPLYFPPSLPASPSAPYSNPTNHPSIPSSHFPFPAPPPPSPLPPLTGPQLTLSPPGTRNRPRKSPIRNRLDNLLLRSRGPTILEPDAGRSAPGAQPRRLPATRRLPRQQRRWCRRSTTTPLSHAPQHATVPRPRRWAAPTHGHAQQQQQQHAAVSAGGAADGWWAWWWWSHAPVPGAEWDAAHGARDDVAAPPVWGTAGGTGVPTAVSGGAGPAGESRGGDAVFAARWVWRTGAGDESTAWWWGRGVWRGTAAGAGRWWGVLRGVWCRVMVRLV